MASRTDSALSATSLLRRYLQVYWLKPFDAVNDTANAWVLRQFDWKGPILELGGGDGLFSFIMHGGECSLTCDRYDQSDPGRAGDIFDTFRRDASLTIKQQAACSYDVGVDLKWTHVMKARETQLYRSLAMGPPEPLPFKAEAFKTVFLYFPHGLRERGTTLNYERVLKEIRRVIHSEGTVLMTAVNQTIANCFVCYPLHRYFKRKGSVRLSEYFKGLDAGRYEEITSLGRPLEEWRKLLQNSGLRLVEVWTQVAPLAWRVYDLQTRPILKPLIRWNWFLERFCLKGVIKTAWIALWLMPLALFYQAFARPRPWSSESAGRPGVFFVFRIVPDHSYYLEHKCLTSPVAANEHADAEGDGGPSPIAAGYFT